MTKKSIRREVLPFKLELSLGELSFTKEFFNERLAFNAFAQAQTRARIAHGAITSLALWHGGRVLAAGLAPARPSIAASPFNSAGAIQPEPILPTQYAGKVAGRITLNVNPKDLGI